MTPQNNYCFDLWPAHEAPQRRQWHPTQVLLPGKFHGWRSLEGCSPWGCWGLDTTEWLHFHFSPSCIGEGNGNPLQCSCLENPRDGGAWWAAVYGVTQSWTQLKRLSSSSSSISFSPLSIMLAVGMSCMVFTVLKNIDSTKSVESFIMKRCLIFTNCFFCIYWNDPWYLPFIWLTWYITITDFYILTHPCILGMNLIWLHCMILSMYSWKVF